MINFPTLTQTLQTNADPERSITFIEGKQDHRVLTYADLLKRATMLLFDLQEAGMQPGDQMIILNKDNQQFIEMFWACVLGGIVPVPVAVGISDEHRAKLFRIFNKLERPYLFTTQDNLERLERFANENDMHESFSIVKRKTTLAHLLEDHGNQGEIHAAQSDDVAFIQFSSGSTSEPKGVVLTHKNIMTNLNAIVEAVHYTRDDISLSWMPLTHDMGLIGFHLTKVASGMNQCLMPTDLFSRRPLLWLEKASELKANILCSPNFGYKHFLKALGSKTLDNVDLSHVRLIYNGAEPISVELCDQFLDAMAAYHLPRQSMFTVYGLAEATLAVSFPPVGVEYRAIWVDRHRMRLGDAIIEQDDNHSDAIGLANEGRAVKDVAIKITDEANQPLPANHIGLVQIKGPSVTAGYYLDDDANKTALTGEGWLNTGDLGFLSGENELVITGRYKDIIFAHGQNYYPHDLEAVALQLPELELGKVVAYGVRQPNAETDELLIFILFRAGIDDFVGVVRDISRHINEQTGLEVARVIPVKRIPKTTSGKLQRRLLADAYQAGEYDEELKQIDELLKQQHTQATEGLSETEARLQRLCEEVMTDTQLDINDNFFEAGISSLTLTEIHQKIDDTWPGVVDVTDLFEHQTMAEVAQFIDDKQSN